jgi:sugar phosphate isomerase/epimerase
MRLCVITDEISQDFEHALDVMREYDVLNAELRGLWGTNIADLDADQVKRSRNALAERGMSVACLATPFFKCELNADDAVVAGRMHLAKARGYGEQLDVLRRCSALAHEFGANLIRVFSFWRRGELTPEIEAQIVDAFAEPLQVAEKEGVTLLLENEHACYIGTGAEAARILSELNSPNARAAWDPGNALLAGELAYPAGYEAISPFVAHVHVKDAVAKSDGTGFDWCVIGEGDLDYIGQFDALRHDGYDGYISLETHYIPQDGTPEDGSRACLAALRRFIKD